LRSSLTGALLSAPVHSTIHRSSIYQRRSFINNFSTSGNFTIKLEMIATASSYIEGAIDSR
jgi:hypothetical protein